MGKLDVVQMECVVPDQCRKRPGHRSIPSRWIMEISLLDIHLIFR